MAVTYYEGHGDLTASSDTTVDNTAQDRWTRVRVYNADTVSHVITFKKGTTPIRKVTLAAGEDDEVGLEWCASGTNLVVNVAEGTTTTVPTYAVNGEYGS